MYIFNGTVISLAEPLTVGGRTYTPFELAQPEVRALIGITTSQHPPMPDPTFWSSAMDESGAWQKTPKRLDDVSGVRRDGEPFVSPGVRSVIAQRMKDETSRRIYEFAPAYKQTNAALALADPAATDADRNAALAMIAKIAAFRAFCDAECTRIAAMEFDALVQWRLPPPADWPSV